VVFPIAYDRVLSAQMGVKAMEMAIAGDYGKMVSYKHPEFVAVTLKRLLQKQILLQKIMH